MVPDPRKRATAFPKGEDAYFITEGRALGVADGVGAWSAKNIDAGVFSRELMSKANQYFSEDASRRDPIEAMAFAEPFAKKHQGSCTFCTLSLDDNNLRSAVLGDSGFVILRRDVSDHQIHSPTNDTRHVKQCNESLCLLHTRSHGGGWKVVYKSQEQQHAFNTPYQIGAQVSGITSRSAVSVTIPLKQGDIVVCGTDGLFDNLFLNDVCQLVGKYLESARGFKSCHGRSVAEQTHEAKKLAEYVTLAAVSASMHPGKRSPFSTQCVKAGYDAHGGKGDDITTVISIVACDHDS